MNILKKCYRIAMDKSDIKLIKKSGLFDEKYYLDNNLDVKESGINPLFHYYHYGWKEGRNPNADFDTVAYINVYKIGNVNPILHAITNNVGGIVNSKGVEIPNINIELIKESGLFDEKYYLKNNLDIQESGIDPLFHYYHHGWKEGRNPNADFDTVAYINVYKIGNVNPILHAITNNVGGIANSKGTKIPNINIELIKKSGLFDEKYYLKNNIDIKKSGIDPLFHYYHYGWKEGRNPNAKVNTNLDSFNDININPLLYIIENPKNKIIRESISKKSITPVTLAKSVSQVMDEYFNDCKFLKTKPARIPLKQTRLNIYYNGFDRGCFFGGKATALLLAINYVNKYNLTLRIISQSTDASIFYEFLKLFDLEQPKKIEFYSIDDNGYLEIDEKDDFLCTMWVNAVSVLNTPTITGNIFYIMQEVETFFYDHGDMCLKCYNTLSNPRLIPIVNSKLLYDYLVNNGYENVKNNGVWFEPVFSKKLLGVEDDKFKVKKKYNLLYYARPSHQRNIFYFGLDVLNTAFVEGKLDPNEWNIYFAGDSSIPNLKFDADIKIKRLGIMSWGKYCMTMKKMDLCYGMIYTPHPSYSPLDAVAAGAVAVTNRYANKKDLSNYSKNIIIANLYKDDMIEALVKGAKLVKDINQRKENYYNSNVFGEWPETFNDAMIYMYSKVGK